MKNIYPVIFTRSKNGYLVEVPDLEILTQGTDLANAIDMARDAINLTCVDLEDDGEPIPEPTPIEKIDVSKGSFADVGQGSVSYVDTDTAEYRRSIEEKAVRRNVTLPSWIDYAAEKAKVNVSKILQEALIKELGLTRAHA